MLSDASCVCIPRIPYPYLTERICPLTCPLCCIKVVWDVSLAHTLFLPYQSLPDPVPDQPRSVPVRYRSLTAADMVVVLQGIAVPFSTGRAWHGISCAKRWRSPDHGIASSLNVLRSRTGRYEDEEAQDRGSLGYSMHIAMRCVEQSESQSQAIDYSSCRHSRCQTTIEHHSSLSSDASQAAVPQQAYDTLLQVSASPDGTTFPSTRGSWLSDVHHADAAPSTRPRSMSACRNVSTVSAPDAATPAVPHRSSCKGS